MNNDWIYIGIFLDEKSKKLLKKLYPLPADFWVEYYDHMTVVFNDNTLIARAVKSVNENNIGKKFKLKLVGPGISDKAYAVQVELPKGVVSANKITHITLATCKPNGGKAVDSNYITNWSKVYDMNKSTAELIADQLTKEKFDILGKVADATIGIHIEGTKAMTPEESKAWHETHAYYDKDGHFIISPDPVEYDGINKIKPNIKL